MKWMRFLSPFLFPNRNRPSPHVSHATLFPFVQTPELPKVAPFSGIKTRSVERITVSCWG